MAPRSQFPQASQQTVRTARIHSFAVCKVTEDDVEAAVELAEQLWAEALKARERADCLSEKAAEQAELAQASAEEATASMDSATTFRLSMLGDARIAMDSQLNAGSLLSEAVEAAEAAELFEAKAEEALTASEKAIEQHLVDFPDADSE
eukprot:CAMPEP_0183350826 /NCGR_PEP_ID=MMETSP0164_2-20130417/21201_1 /TAXON_ID=221442 /ORGANISM="Coccolithus pelagicus ssp braarudi, Strain PLY182g" /LENGTH=148 /DNA_ID=CAMNT_0025522829 /DNA_START=65 /DNA_END=511 /DNA_ORIENTATION=-